MSSKTLPTPVATTPAQLRELLQCTPTRTSDKLNWAGISAETYANPLPADLTLPPLRDHLLIVYLNDGLQENQRHCDDKDKGRSAGGEMSLIVAGRPVRWCRKAGFDSLQVFIKPALISKVAGQVFSDLGPAELINLLKFRNESLHSICLALYDELHSGELGNKLYIESLGTAVAVLLLRQCSSCKESVAATGPPAALLEWQWRRVTEYVNTHLDADLSLCELAKIAGISVYHFARLFKDTSGISPHQYVMQQRVEHSKELLRDKRLTILEVCLAVGFLNPAHFTTVFRKLIGVTPKAYRKDH